MRSGREVWRDVIFPVLGYFRKRRGRFIMRQFPDIATFRICDLGGSQHFWDKLDIPVPPSQVTIYNISPNETQPVAAGTADQATLILYDGDRVPAPDLAYDLCISNSVLEHVAPAERPAFAREVMRLAPRIMLQTPAFEFPIEPHFVVPFLHWLPRWLGYPIAAVSPWRLIGRPHVDTLREFYFGTRLLARRELKALFPGCEIFSETFLSMTKSHYVVRTR